MPAYCSKSSTDPVVALIAKTDVAFLTWLRAPVYTDESTKTCDAFTDAQHAIYEAAPKTIDGFLAKWTAFLYFETSLEMDDLDYVKAMQRMVDDVAAIVERSPCVQR